MRTLLSVDSEVKEVNGHNVTFVRIGDRMGWFARKDGKPYGSWSQLNVKKDLTESIHETLLILEGKARETLKEK